MNVSRRTKQVTQRVQNEFSRLWWSFIKDNPDKPWYWKGVTRNPNITWDIIKDNPDKPWNWWFISCNPNINWDIIKK